MISKRIAGRVDGKSSAMDALRYGAGLKLDRATGEYLDKSHRIRLGGFDLVENGVYINQDTAIIKEIIGLAALEMQANCDLNTKVGEENKIAHFIFSYNQEKPDEVALRKTEDLTLKHLKLGKNHYASFLHCDNGHWHLHLFVSRISADKFHLGNSLWRDRLIRDYICRHIEGRHNLKRDNGLHKIDALGHIVQIPISERRENRNNKKSVIRISDKARKFEKHTGEKSLHTWCFENNIGDQLKHSNSWGELHKAASKAGGLIQQKGAGFVFCPVDEKGGIQLSRLGLKNLVNKFGEFKPATLDSEKLVSEFVHTYKPEPTKPAKILFEKWKIAHSQYINDKSYVLSEFRKVVSEKRLNIRVQQKNELEQIRSKTSRINRVSEISIAKMKHATALTELSEAIRHERSEIYRYFEKNSPGATFKEYLIHQAQAGDDAALTLARQYGEEEATSVSRQSEAARNMIVASLSGFKVLPVSRLRIKHQVESNGTVIYDLGEGRIVIDSSIAKQIQLNEAAATDPAAIATTLRFSTLKFGNTLSLMGSPSFQRLAVETAVRSGLFIKFSDPELEQYRKDFSSKLFNSSTTKENINVRSAQRIQSQHQFTPNSGNSLHQLPKRELVPESSIHQMLLQADVQTDLGKRNGASLQRQHSSLRQSDLEGASDERQSGSHHPTTSGSTTELANSSGTGNKTQAVNATVKKQEIYLDQKKNSHSMTNKAIDERKPLPGNIIANKPVER